MLRLLHPMKKLVFTGGHHTSALAVIDALDGQQLSAISYQLHFIGHRYSIHGGRVESAEYQEVTKRGISFYSLTAGKVYRKFNFLEWFRVPFGFFQALWILYRIKPDLIVSFGGYLAVPVVIAGWLFGIPSVTHEQTVVSGWANRIIARFACKVFISWPESEKFFPSRKVVLTGLPLRKEIVSLAKELEKIPNTKYQTPNTIYITGGKQGSQTINQAVGGCLGRLLREFEVVHQCGSFDFKKFLALEDSLSENLKARYIVKDYFSQEEIGRVFRVADLVVGRAGAHTVYELAALGKPAILIPIPWSSHNEQQENAEILERVGLAEVISQDNLRASTLFEACYEVGKHLEGFREAGRKARKLVCLDAAERIADKILFLVSS